MQRQWLQGLVRVGPPAELRLTQPLLSLHPVRRGAGHAGPLRRARGQHVRGGSAIRQSSALQSVRPRRFLLTRPYQRAALWSASWTRTWTQTWTCPPSWPRRSRRSSTESASRECALCACLPHTCAACGRGVILRTLRVLSCVPASLYVRVARQQERHHLTVPSSPWPVPSRHPQRLRCII